MILLISAILLTLFAIFGAIAWQAKKGGGILSILTIVSGVLSPLLIAACCTLYMGNLEDRAKLEAIYFNNIQNYQVAITETTTYLSQDEFINQLIAGSIEKTNLGEQIAGRIAEWRNIVNDYNIQYNIYKAMSGNIFTGIFYPEIPDELRMLTISTTNSSQ